MDSGHVRASARLVSIQTNLWPQLSRLRHDAQFRLFRPVATGRRLVRPADRNSAGHAFSSQRAASRLANLATAPRKECPFHDENRSLCSHRTGCIGLRALVLERFLKSTDKISWILVAETGCYRQFKQSTKPVRVTVARHPKGDVASGTLKSILRQAGNRRSKYGCERRFECTSRACAKMVWRCQSCHR